MSAVGDAFQRSVDEGQHRLERSTSSLIATGLVGGLDVSVGVFALLLVKEATHNEVLSAIAFGIGFIGLTLANSELFTENFLVPITAVVAKKARWWTVLRLWLGTAIFNLTGAWVAMGLAMLAFPKLHAVAVEVGSHPMGLAFDKSTFANAIIGGAVITLMTWMERSTPSVGAKIVSAWIMAFVLSLGPLQHAIVISVEAFAALHVGAPFGYLHWFEMLLFASLGNAIGGVGLVTALRLMQVETEEIRAEQERPKDQERETEPEVDTD
jgi:formate/nitrite transporter FocA (FNT family)